MWRPASATPWVPSTTPSSPAHPLLITAGQQEQGHGLTEPVLYDPLVPIAAPLVKWAVEVTRLEDLPRIVRRAAKIATTPPTGPVFLSLPGDVLNDEKGVDLGKSTRVDTVVRPGDDADWRRLAVCLVKAQRPALLVGHEVVTSDAFEDIARFAGVLGAPAYQQTVPFGAHFPSEHPAFMGALSRDQKDVRKHPGRARPADRRRRRRAAHVRLAGDRPAAAGPAADPARPARLGDGQELSGRDRHPRGPEGDPRRADPDPRRNRRRAAASRGGNKDRGRRRLETGPRNAPGDAPQQVNARARRRWPGIG